MTYASSYKELIVWQKAIAVTIAIYAITSKFPRTEQFGLTSQMRRAAVSIASNIAEGRSRGTRNDFAHFLQIAFASGAELETQIIIAKQLHETAHLNYKIADTLLEETMKILNTFIHKIRMDPKS